MERNYITSWGQMVIVNFPNLEVENLVQEIFPGENFLLFLEKSLRETGQENQPEVYIVIEPQIPLSSPGAKLLVELKKILAADEVH